MTATNNISFKQAALFSFGTLGGIVILRNYALIPLYLTKMAFGASFFTGLKAMMSAPLTFKALALITAKVTLFAGASIVAMIGFVYLNYKAAQFLTRQLHQAIEKGDVQSVRRLRYLLPLAAIWRMGFVSPLDSAIASKNPKMFEEISSFGLSIKSWEPVYSRHFHVKQEHIVALLDSESDASSMLKVALKYVVPEEGIFAHAAFPKYAKVFADGGFESMAFLGALQHPMGDSAAHDLLNRGLNFTKAPLPLHHVQTVSLARRLIERGVSPHQLDTSGSSPLHKAAEKGLNGLFSFLVSLGLDPFARNKEGKSPFDLACANGHIAIIENIILLHGEKKWSMGLSQHGRPLWFRAASEGRLAMLERLFNTGLYQLQTDREGKMALHWSAKHGHTESVQFLANRLPIFAIDLEDRWGATAAQLAFESGHVETYKKLIEMGAHPSTGARTWE